MNEVRFQEIIAAYGADPRRWPDAERSAALGYGETNAANPALRDAAALDALLAGYSAAPASSDLEIIARISRKVSAAAPQSARSGAGRTGRMASLIASGRNAAAAAGFLAAALTGLFIGFSNGASGVSTADASDELVAAYALAEG